MKKDQGHTKSPNCFGKIDVVFPMGKEGLRSSPEACLRCDQKVACLRDAVQGADGLKVKSEAVDRAYASGMITFMERWSKKKDIDRKIREKAPGRQKGKKLSGKRRPSF